MPIVVLIPAMHHDDNSMSWGLVDAYGLVSLIALL